LTRAPARASLTDVVESRAVTELVARYDDYGVTSNEKKLTHFYWFCVGALYRWLRSAGHNPVFT